MRDGRALHVWAAALLAPLAAPALAETPPVAVDRKDTPAAATPPTQAAPANGIDATQLQLRGVRDRIDASEAKRQALIREISGLETDRAKFEGQLIETTRKVTDDEAKVEDARNRLDMLSSQETAAKHSLGGRRAVVAEILAALQRMGRKPPPALLVAPDDVLKAIRTSMLLGTLLPGMRTEIDALTIDLAKLARAREGIEEERNRLEIELASLADERLRLSAFIDARQAALGRARHDVDAEQDAARKLAGQAVSLKDLIAGMERESAAAAQAAEAARRSDQKLSGSPADDAAPGRDLARLTPAVAFASTKGLLPRPVSGQTLRRFGQDDGLGSAEKGELLATGTRAVVAAPADGWVAFAGPYRSFGKLLILNAGGGYYIVLAGMERINVELGQFVLAGEPIATMGDGSARTAAAVALGAAQPLLYVEFRKDGAAIDPGPWWARPELQKVRG